MVEFNFHTYESPPFPFSLSSWSDDLVDKEYLCCDCVLPFGKKCIEHFYKCKHYMETHKGRR